MAAVAVPWIQPPMLGAIRLSDADIEVLSEAAPEAAPDTDRDPVSQSERPTVRELDDEPDYDDETDRTLPSVPVPNMLPVERKVVLDSSRLVLLCGAWALAGLLLGVAAAFVFVAAVTL